MLKKFKLVFAAKAVEVADDGAETVWANDSYVAENLDYGGLVTAEAAYIDAKVAFLRKLQMAGVSKAVENGSLTEAEANAVRFGV